MYTLNGMKANRESPGNTPNEGNQPVPNYTRFLEQKDEGKPNLKTEEKYSLDKGTTLYKWWKRWKRRTLLPVWVLGVMPKVMTNPNMLGNL